MSGRDDLEVHQAVTGPLTPDQVVRLVAGHEAELAEMQATTQRLNRLARRRRREPERDPEAPASDRERSAAGSTGAGPAVKAGRTPPRVKENPEYAGFVRRSIRAMGRRVTDHADVEGLGEMAALSADLDQAIGEAVTGLRVQWGMSWADIGAALGVTRQAAYDRWGKR